MLKNDIGAKYFIKSVKNYSKLPRIMGFSR